MSPLLQEVAVSRQKQAKIFAVLKCAFPSMKRWLTKDLTSAGRELHPTISLPSIFGFSVGYRLPLHIERGVRSTAFQRSDMIDHVSRTATLPRYGRWTGMQAFELIFSLRASFIAAMAGVWAVGTQGRAMAATSTG